MRLFYDVISAVGALASIVSAVVAFRAKSKAEKVLLEINGVVKNEVELEVKGDNRGVINGVNAGEINAK